MFKLMIADDESRIRRGIRKSIPWEELDIELIGEAEDGEMALSLAEKTCPDIILLDICMPFLSGLELVRKLKSVDRECMIIIITGHDEFEYIQQAIKLKIFDYILKPVKKENLKDAVIRAIQELNKVREGKNYLNWVNKQFDNNISTLRQSFLNDWLSGEMSFEEVVNELKFLKIKIDNSAGIIIIKPLGRFNTELASKKWDNKLLSFAIINLVYDTLDDFEPVFDYIDSEDNIVMVFNTDNYSNWIDIGTVIEENIQKYLKFNILIEQRRIFNGIVGVKQAYKSLVNVVSRKAELKPIVLLAVKYIEANYFSNDLSLEIVAEQFNTNPSYLSRIIKQETGFSFIDYLTNLRIKKATFIMDDPTIKIYQVAEMVGYSNQHYFCKAFKKIMGISPTEYRGGTGNV